MAPPERGSAHPITDHNSFIDLERMKGWVGLVGLPCSRTVYPHEWSPISCRSSVGQGKFAGHRPTLYHCATQPTMVVECYFPSCRVSPPIDRPVPPSDGVQRCEQPAQSQTRNLFTASPTPNPTHHHTTQTKHNSVKT